MKLITLYEQVLTESDEQELKAAFDILDKDITAATRDVESEMTEDVSSIIGLVLSGPFMVKLFGKFIKFIEKKIAKFKKEEPTQVGIKIINFANKFHHIIMIPFQKLAKLLIKDKNKQDKLANYMFHGVIGLLLIQGGVKIASTITSDMINSNLAFDLAKNGVKSAELSSGLRAIIKASLAKLGEDIGEFQ